MRIFLDMYFYRYIYVSHSTIICLDILYTNLKEGSGKLCAGQTSVVSLDSCLVIPFEFISSENLGFALPIGSGQKIKKNNVYPS